MRRVFEEASGPRRRVYLSTNVAETSITLPGVTWVIDSGLARMQLHRAGRTALALTPIAHDSMEQRAGRAGRVAPGTCLRLWERHWAPPRATSPEIERVALDDFILRAGICGLDGADFDDAPWVTPPPDFATVEARAHLRGVGALDSKNRVTTHGRALAGLPVSAFEARLLHEPPRALATAMADIVAFLQRGRRLALRLDQLRRDAEAVREAREELFEGCTNEVFEALRVLRAGHAQRHGLRRAALEETRRLAKQLRAAIGAPTDLRADAMALPDADALARHLFTRAPEVGFALRPRAQGAKAARSRSKAKPWGNGEVELMVDPFVPLREDDRPREGEEPIAGALLDHVWLGDSKGLGVTGRGSMLLPASPKLMADCGLGEVSITEVRARRGKVIANVRRELAGATLSVREEKLRGAVLCEEAARLILKGQLMGEAGGLVLDDLHLLELLSQWRHTTDTEHFDLERLNAIEVPDPQEFLSGRLRELGLTTSDELALLEPDDLRPDLAGLTRLASWDLDALREDFPRIWTYQSSDYACAVNLAARRVTIEPANKAARSRKEPPRGVLPRFRGFSVVFRQDSRTLPLRG
jgi:ATP-dependent helicase HrpB